MKKIKRILSVFLVALLIIGSMPVSAFAVTDNTPKEEVVYINLNADGSVKEINVVNIFDLDKDGKIIDYGKYESLRNMTTTDKIGYSGENITIDAKAGKLYYEGKLDNNVMPWNISIKYFMDGKEYKSNKIAGRSGNLKISIDIDKNKECIGNFFEGYALQASVTLDTKKCSNIQADGATIANVGSNKQLTYTILPNQGADIEITANVTDFEMTAISINGIKLNLSIEIDDATIQEKIDEIISAVNILDNGANELNNGTKDLYDGTTLLKDKVGELYNGVGALSNGAGELSNGLNTIVSKSEELLNGAYQAFQGLCTASETILNAELIKNGLQPITLTPENYTTVLTELINKTDPDTVYNIAYNTALAEVTTQVEKNQDAIYNGYIEQNADAIYLAYIESQADAIFVVAVEKIVIEQLMATGMSEAWAKAMLSTSAGQRMVTEVVSRLTDEQKQEIIYAAVTSLTDEQKAQIRAGSVASLTDEQKTLIKEGYIEQTMKSKEVTDQITAAVASANSAVASIAELKGQLDNYSLFYEGLKSYTSAVSTVANGAGELKTNMDTLYLNVGTLKTSVGDLNNGVKTLFDGTTEFKNGTGEFVKETNGIDAVVRNEINSMISSASGSDIEIISFVSENNTNIKSVQFVIQTETIEIAEVINTEPIVQEKLNFWQKLLRLFGLY